jgi:hypothetical protein
MVVWGASINIIRGNVDLKRAVAEIDDDAVSRSQSVNWTDRSVVRHPGFNISAKPLRGLTEAMFR